MSAGRVGLIADDHELFRAGLGAVLKSRLGFATIVEAASLDEAIECLGQNDRISFASFDLNMPGVGSAASLHDVRAAFPTVRIVVVAGSTHRETVLTALTAGVHGYIPKALTIDGVVDAIDLVLNGHVYVPSSLAEPSVDRRKPSVPAPATEPRGAPTAAGAKLTPRQYDVLACIAQGKSNKEIARALNLADGTVKVHVAALFRTLGVHNRVSAAAVLKSIRT